MITVVVLEIIRREKFFAFAALMASLGFWSIAFLFQWLNAIIQRNVYRSWHGKNLNVPPWRLYPLMQIPFWLMNFWMARCPLHRARQGNKARLLACYRYFADSPRTTTYDWRSFNWSSWQAERSLEIVRPHLAGYVIRYNRWLLRVRTPGGDIYECEQRTARGR
ncbi:MAG: hypothetical protein U0V48_01500 [Anaerolineales bacterium]